MHSIAAINSKLTITVLAILLFSAPLALSANSKPAGAQTGGMSTPIPSFEQNNNKPAVDGPRFIPVFENTPRDTVIGSYTATDEDEGDTITYSGDSKSFEMNPVTGELMTLESLDADSNTPCGSTG